MHMLQELQPEMAALDIQDVPVGVTADPCPNPRCTVLPECYLSLELMRQTDSSWR